MFHYLTGVAVTSLDHGQLKSIVQAKRTKEYGEWWMAIQLHPLKSCSPDDDRPFLQFMTTVANIPKKKFETMIGFAHPDLMYVLMHGAVPLYIDGTFACVPKGFEQLLVIMAYDRASRTYVPIFFVLLENKKESTYKDAMCAFQRACDGSMQASTYTCDFSAAW